MMFIFIVYLLVGFGVTMGTYEGYRNANTGECDLTFSVVIGCFWIITLPWTLMNHLAKRDSI